MFIKPSTQNLTAFYEHNVSEKPNCPLCEAGVPKVEKPLGQSVKCVIEETGEVVDWYLSHESVERIEKALGHKIDSSTKLSISFKGGVSCGDGKIKT
jgi:hypothetical protein